MAMSAKGHNAEGSAEKLREFLRIALQQKPLNMGDMRQMDTRQIIERVRDTSIVHAVFCDKETVAQVPGEVKKADLGMSVVVSGLFRLERECCEKAGLKEAPHTMEHSLAV